MDVNNDAVKTIANEMIKAIQEAIKLAPFDRTIKARILSNPESNKYIVQLDDGQEYTATSEKTYNVNDIVYVTIAGNNYNNLFISSGVTHINYTE